MSKRLITIIDPSVEVSEVSKRHVTTIRNGRVTRQQTLRTETIKPLRFVIEIEARPGITHALERRRTRDALRGKFGASFDHIRRNSDGTYTI